MTTANTVWIPGDQLTADHRALRRGLDRRDRRVLLIRRPGATRVSSEAGKVRANRSGAEPPNGQFPDSR